MAKRAKKKHPGSIIRRGSTLRVLLCVRGHREEHTLHTTDRREAEAFAMARHAELVQVYGKQQRTQVGPVRISALLDRFEREIVPTVEPNTRRTYRNSLAVLRQFFVARDGDPFAFDVKEGDVLRFRAWRLGGGTGRPVSKQTADNDRRVLHRVCDYGLLLGYVLANPVTKATRLAPELRDPVILSDLQFESLLRCCEGRPVLWLYVLLLNEAGLRCESEALWLRWEDLDFEANRVHVVNGRDGHKVKGKRSRKVPMTERLRTALLAHTMRCRAALYPAHGGMAPSPWVFHHTATRAQYRAGERVKVLRPSFEAAKARAGLPDGFVQHDLRHRRVTTWLQAEQSVVKIGKAVGHRNVRTTQLYEHLVDADLDSLVGSPAPPSPTPSREALRGA